MCFITISWDLRCFFAKASRSFTFQRSLEDLWFAFLQQCQSPKKIKSLSLLMYLKYKMSWAALFQLLLATSAPILISIVFWLSTFLNITKEKLPVYLCKYYTYSSCLWTSTFASKTRETCTLNCLHMMPQWFARFVFVWLLDYSKSSQTGFCDFTNQGLIY